MNAEKYRILVVEDDEQIAQAIAAKLAGWNMETIIPERFDDIFSLFVEKKPHLVIMDISLPSFDGYYWCEQIRRHSKVPILFLSSASENLSTILALHSGADEFVTKPFDLDVLLARIQALLRRSYDFNTLSSFLFYAGLSLNLDEQSVSFQDEQVPLSRNEFRILQVLMENKEKVVSRELLMDRLWKTQQFVDDNTLSVNVNRLRKKLEALGLRGLLQTRIGQGYLLSRPDVSNK